MVSLKFALPIAESNPIGKRKINMMDQRCGKVAIIGQPNVGKSTFSNAFVGERLSIITAKAQTTRHRILGFMNDENYQLIISDTPGVIKPFGNSHASHLLDALSRFAFWTDILTNLKFSDLLSNLS